MSKALYEKYIDADGAFTEEGKLWASKITAFLMLLGYKYVVEENVIFRGCMLETGESDSVGAYAYSHSWVNGTSRFILTGIFNALFVHEHRNGMFNQKQAIGKITDSFQEIIQSIKEELSDE